MEALKSGTAALIVPVAGGIPFAQRIGCTVDQAVEASSLSRRKIYQLIADGALESRQVGGRRVIMVASLRRLIEGDKAEGPGGGQAAA